MFFFFFSLWTVVYAQVNLSFSNHQSQAQIVAVPRKAAKVITREKNVSVIADWDTSFLHWSRKKNDGPFHRASAKNGRVYSDYGR